MSYVYVVGLRMIEECASFFTTSYTHSFRAGSLSESIQSIAHE